MASSENAYLFIGSKQIKFTPMGAPGAPTSLGFDYLTLSWSAGDVGSAGPTLGYGIEVEPKGPIIEFTSSDPANGGSASISNVQPDVEYTFDVYGVNQAGRGESAVIKHSFPYNVATGGTVTDVDNYNGTGEKWRVHTFTGNGTLDVVTSFKPFRVLVCAGGGGGCRGQDGGWWGAGGGAGGLLYYESQSLEAGSHSVVVGGGGGGSNNAGSPGGNGGNSSLGDIVATGGGGATTNGNARSGGSGGGSAYHNGGKGIPGQGHNGVTAGGRDYPAYGGGASGTPAGRTLNITGSDYVYATGGRGGHGGTYGKGGDGRDGGTRGDPGIHGVVIVAYQIG